MDENCSENSKVIETDRKHSNSKSLIGLQNSFHLKDLQAPLKICIREHDGEIDMDLYIEIFEQLQRFFCSLGTIFSFVSSDVKGKVEILQTYRTGENGHHYETVEKMIIYEKEADILTTNKSASGSRTLLRLHRAMIFVAEFLNRAKDIEDDERTSDVCKSAYRDTLGKHHPWLIQKGAVLAMYTLPTKKDLISKVCCDHTNPDVELILNEVIQYTKSIYNQLEDFYKQHDLLNLP